MKWVIESVVDNSRPFRQTFESVASAEAMIERFASGFNDQYRVMPESIRDMPEKAVRMLREGLVKGDLRGILLPKLSVDQYLHADPKTDNVVVAFFIKGVPEAVLPVKNYIDHCNGVIDVDYGDSETIPNCSIVYAELLRDKLNTQDIHAMVDQLSKLSSIRPEDFTVTFPNTDDKFPYDPKVLDEYFALRTEEDNQAAQDRAIAAANAESNDANGVETKGKIDQVSNESLVNRLVSLFG